MVGIETQGAGMTELGHIAATLFRKRSGQKRLMVAIAGPPGAGKSSFSETLLPLLPEGTAAIVQMDGFHYDNAILETRGLLPRKGAPETFDFSGFRHLLERLRAADDEVTVPVFDRAADLARANASIVTPEIKFVLVEGNYLLLEEGPWYGLAPLFDFSIFIDVPRAELARRLVQRWVEHGLSPEAARERAFSNDMANAERILTARREADVVFKPETEPQSR
jgi:pantothenate kinase